MSDIHQKENSKKILSNCFCRHVLFTMIEEYPADWREETLGYKLMDLIDKMRVHLSKEKLPSYFIRKQVRLVIELRRKNIPNYFIPNRKVSMN